MIFELKNIFYFSATETVNRLIIITDNTNIGLFSGKHLQKPKLRHV